MRANGYQHETEFWKGHSTLSKKGPSWGHHMNMSFQEMIEAVTVNSKFRDRSEGVSFSKRILTRFGFCYEVKADVRRFIFSTLEVFGNKHKEISMFITDKSTQTYFNIDYTSQTGNIHYIVKLRGI